MTVDQNIYKNIILTEYSGGPFERPPLLERPLGKVNLNINIFFSTSDERPPLLKGHFSGTQGVASPCTLEHEQ